MDEEIASINVIPLVDIMLVLLTIVLTTATFVAVAASRSIWRARPTPSPVAPVLWCSP